jgi:hypothetical protein
MAETVDVRRLRDDLAAALGADRVEFGDDSLAEHPAA